MINLFKTSKKTYRYVSPMFREVSDTFRFAQSPFLRGPCTYYLIRSSMRKDYFQTKLHLSVSFIPKWKPHQVQSIIYVVKLPQDPLQFLQQIQKQQLAKVSEIKIPSPQDSRFMNKVRFSIVGYNLQDKRISNIIKFLTEHGGAEFVESLSPSKVDMIVVSRRFQNKTNLDS